VFKYVCVQRGQTTAQGRAQSQRRTSNICNGKTD
jgi:hypothetical protein